MLKIIDRYIFKEIFAIFSVGLLVFTFVLLLNKIIKLIELIIEKGVPATEIVKLVGYLLPSLFSVTIPMSLLLATLVTFGRLSADSELTALKSSGFSLYRLMVPVGYFAVIAYLITTLMMIYLFPWGNYSFKRLFFDIVKTKASVGIEEGVFNNTFDGLVMMVNRVSPTNQMEGVFIFDERDPKDPYTIIAKKGSMLSDPIKLVVFLKLNDGTVHKSVKKMTGSYEQVKFQTYELQLDINKALSGQEKITKGKRDMRLSELRRMIEQSKQKGENYFSWLFDLHKKFSIPVACLVFALIGPPLGSITRQAGKGGGFALSILVILIYYMLISAGENLSGEGKLHPFFAAWMPNILFGAMGGYLLIKAARESQFVFVERLRVIITEVVNKTFKRKTL
ncbi:MAG: LPS export ABC transporter permease LptF [Nitrospirota bacterium]